MNLRLVKILLTTAVSCGYSGMIHAQQRTIAAPASFRLSLTYPTIPAVVLPPVDVPVLQAEDRIRDAQKLPYRFGYNQETNLSVTNSGFWQQGAGGLRIWRLCIRSAGAQTLNLGFSHFFLSPGSSLYVYTADHAILLGPYTHQHNFPDGEMATDLLAADEVILELDEPDTAQASVFTLCRVTHGYRSFDYARSFGQA
ncbi:MAG TPA: hypothetical protein VNZ86_20635, partial [Bacteroidia bacterium]|nr:hypothetical protein [Bacteroidia bacterium]